MLRRPQSPTGALPTNPMVTGQAAPILFRADKGRTLAGEIPSLAGELFLLVLWRP